MATKEEIIDAISKMTVLEISDLIKMMEEKFGVTAAAAVVAGNVGGGNAAVEEEEQTEFTVVLKGVDATKKIACIKEVRAITSLGLKEAKTLCEEGGTVKENVSKADAKEMKEKLEAAGCTIEVK